MTQNEAIIETIRMLGGIAILGDIYQNAFKIEDCKWGTKTPHASIRRIVRTTQGIYRIKPGLYALESHRKQLEANGIVEETEFNKTSKVVQDFNHSYYQGLILTIGNLKKLQTFCPNQDKNKRFASGCLDDLRSLHQIPSFSYEELIHRSSTIDVIWFNERIMPHSFFEVEHSTDIINSLGKFNDLQDFYTAMYIVADKKREQEFKVKYNTSSFKDIREKKRVKFLSYDDLEKQYRSLIEVQEVSTLII